MRKMGPRHAGQWDRMHGKRGTNCPKSRKPGDGRKRSASGARIRGIMVQKLWSELGPQFSRHPGCPKFTESCPESAKTRIKGLKCAGKRQRMPGKQTLTYRFACVRADRASFFFCGPLSRDSTLHDHVVTLDAWMTQPNGREPRTF